MNAVKIIVVVVITAVLSGCIVVPGHYRGGGYYGGGYHGGHYHRR